MPYVSLITERKCSAAEQLKLKSGIADILAAVLDKEESGLVVTFPSVDGFFRAGEKSANAAVVEVRYIGQFSLDKKQELTRKLCELCRAILAADPEKVIVPITEMVSENWGRRAGNYK